jgi:hypothetical protein
MEGWSPVTTTEDQSETCPVLDFDYTATKPEGTWLRTYDELRAQFPGTETNSARGSGRW